MSLQKYIKKLALGKSLSTDEAQEALTFMMSGEGEGAELGAFLALLTVKGVTKDEVLGATRVMRSLMSPVDIFKREHLIDTCGTGGDAHGLFNVSTAVSFVAAAAGATVAKHGNRAVSSTSGSADVFATLGVDLSDVKGQVKSINELGVGFLFAPNHHSAMRHVGPVRNSLGIKTIFNVLGPLLNPACVRRQIIGVYESNLMPIIIDALVNLGSEHVLACHGRDGLDEMSVVSSTEVLELKNNKIKSYRIEAQEFGMKHNSLEGFVVKNADESLKIIRRIFAGENSAGADLVALNAGAAIYVAGITKSLKEGVSFARELLRNGSAEKKIESFTKSL